MFTRVADGGPEQMRGFFPFSAFMVRLTALYALVLISTGACLAHPMGNFSINHYSGLRVEQGFVEVKYIIDLAEIPTYQEIQNAGIVARVGDATLPPYLKQQAGAWERGIRLEVDGKDLALKAVSESVIFPPGAGGLPTMKIGVVYRATMKESAGPDSPTKMHLRYVDGNFEGRAGWKEIVVSTGRGVVLQGTNAFKLDRSAQLTDYPTNLLNSPPQDLEADFEYSVEMSPVVVASTPTSAPVKTVGVTAPPVAQPSVAAPIADRPVTVAPALQLAPNRQSTPRNRFTELMANPEMGFWFLVTAAFLAAGLGAAHALEPGHGKTIVAAYLVGSRGRTRHAVGLGLLVTAAHTAGVYALGAVVLYASKYVIPERIYPWLSIFSGLVIAMLAGYLLLRTWTGVEEPEHEDGVMHSHWYSTKRDRGGVNGVDPFHCDEAAMDGTPRMIAAEKKGVSLKQLLLLGITGGIIPCPAALVVLLSAVSLHRVGLGLFLIVAFSAGLAAVLIAIGIAMVKAQTLLSRWKTDSPLLKNWLPMGSATAMLIAGLAIAGSALPATGITLHLADVTGGHVASFLGIVGLGLFLGMRHSTDPDHVVAVSTIVSRERSVKQGAVIGMMWGFGHTLTIFIVGALIILFNLTIPPRIGLSMEMAVAGMLILLGVLNLTGAMKRITARFQAAPGMDLDETVSEVGRQGFAGRMVGRFGYFNLLRPLAIGLVHGLAGSAAVALLVLSMIHSPAWAIAYLVVFGLGTVAGMMLMTTVMAIPIALTGKSVSKSLTTVSGLVSVCFGLFLVYHLGFVDGMFTSHVHWTPE